MIKSDDFNFFSFSEIDLLHPHLRRLLILLLLLSIPSLLNLNKSQKFIHTMLMQSSATDMISRPRVARAGTNKLKC